MDQFIYGCYGDNEISVNKSLGRLEANESNKLLEKLQVELLFETRHNLGMLRFELIGS